jgi:serine O-acetyltransferase
MFETIHADMRAKGRWYDLPDTPSSTFRMLLSDGSTTQLLYRAMRFCQTHRLKLAAAIIYRLNAAIGHAVIGRGADFGPGLVILHSFGLVINTQVKAGRNLVLEHGVTIGAEKRLSPRLGDNVYIGAGAKIVGGVVIGSDVKIGANAVVVSDIPDGATAVGIPARVVSVYGRRVTAASLPSSPSRNGKGSVGRRVSSQLVTCP